MKKSMDRRGFMGRAAMISGALAISANAANSDEVTAPSSATPSTSGSFSQDKNRVHIYSPHIRKPFKILMIADTHLFRDDERGEKYREFSARMAKAYNQTKHFQTGKTTNPEEGLKEALQKAKAQQADLVALVGDIVSFPSEAAIEWAMARIQETGLPWFYTAGNHDWHYEGMEGSADSLRAKWIDQRLAPFYQNDGRLMSVRELNGTRIISIDNSTYEILPEQLEFFRKQVATGAPLVLFVHIPLYAPGRDLDYGCGNPEWGAKNDHSYQLERRQKWREGGHTKVTMDFHREVFSCSNLLGVFAGHTHRAALDVMNGIPQFVTDANATGAYMELEFLPVA
ncbi:metallophosphoesterase [Luteolibacter pohnpeiensis]|uniref:Metallophosphoesterase n=1 Tax=Luteolibacter pohnpeiensis TaxID=454153 RepID=A0A934S8M6_9BACT|nr:metallophosphoesterase [Luteolibacter pohnpeiensis]MBK1883828.1 metallophosphoesterase [Luteolibacter pohnpeiensis]